MKASVDPNSLKLMQKGRRVLGQNDQQGVNLIASEKPCLPHVNSIEHVHRAVCI